jgi:hypothetical protein
VVPSRVAQADPIKEVLIDFEDLAAGTTPDVFTGMMPLASDHYASQGVMFSNAAWRNQCAHLTGSSGDICLMAEVGAYGNPSGYQPDASHPIEGVFLTPVTFVSFTALDVGEQGARLAAYDKKENRISFDELYGPGQGTGNYGTLTVTEKSIWSFQLYQPISLKEGLVSDGVVWDDLSFDRIKPVPEPSTLALLGIGIVGLIGYGWRRSR